MNTLIDEIVRKLYILPEAKLLEVLGFVEFLTGYKQSESNSLPQRGDDFEALADHLADEFNLYVGATVPTLSEYAVSRAGIYEEHP